MGQIYRLDFENGKSYIGATTNDANYRFKEHKRSTRRLSEILLYKAWRKYGEPRLIILAIIEDHDLFETEMKAIAAYNTKAPDGYNLTDGGEGTIGYKHSDSVIEANRLRNVGRKQTEETRANVSKSLIGNQRAKGNKHKLTDAQCLTRSIQKLGNTATVGMKWFNNGYICKRSKECPEGFIPGRLKKSLKL
jgi:group I intron endonuclease